jgi:hypothetical protein
LLQAACPFTARCAVRRGGGAARVLAALRLGATDRPDMVSGRFSVFSSAKRAVDH